MPCTIPQALVRCIFLLLPMSLCACSSMDVISTEPVRSEPQSAQTGAGPPVLIYKRTLSDEVWQHADRLGAERCINVIGYYGDRDRDGKVDLQQLQQGIDEWVPHDFRGYATLDLEHPYTAWLREGPGTRHFEQAEAEMLKALRLAKRIRPHVKWAYWGLPRVDPFPLVRGGGDKRPLNKQSRSAREQLLEKAMAPAFLAEQDWYCVSVYDQWMTDQPWQRELQGELIRMRLEAARQVAGGKPVIACIWHRQHDKSNTLLTKNEWGRDQIIASLDAGADGVCWWAHDRTSWLKPWPGSSPMPETAGMSNAEIGRYFDKMHADYTEYLIETVRSHRHGR